MCPICIKDCPFLEIGLSAFRGREVLYPSPRQFGWSTAGALKDFGLDWSHFTILSRLRGAKGIAEDPDLALFPNVDIQSQIGGIKLKIPIANGGVWFHCRSQEQLGWTRSRAALAGIILVIGEDVCGMDPQARFTKGKVTHSPDLEYRVKKFREFWDPKFGM
jgi:hypothetical protein